MPELSALLANKRWVNCDANGFEFQVAYRPGVTSLKRQAEMQRELRLLQHAEGMDELEAVRKVAEVMAEMICDWDLTDQGRTIPITVETITELPNVVYNAISEAIANDGKLSDTQKKTSSANSVGASAAGGKQAVTQNGTGQYEQRGTWA